MISGRNDCGQLGFGDTKRRDLPEAVPLLEGINIVNAAVGKNHTMFLTGKEFLIHESYCLHIHVYIPWLSYIILLG